MKHLAGLRVSLEPLQVRHADELFEGLQDERLYTWIDELPPENLEWLRKRYEKHAARRSPDGAEIWLNWAIFSVNDRKYVGYVQGTLRGKIAYIAYVLFFDSWGKGLAKEAVAIVINELHGAYGILELRATVDLENIRSIALLTTLGFGKEKSKPKRKLPDSEALFRRHLG